MSTLPITTNQKALKNISRLTFNFCIALKQANVAERTK